MSKTSLNVFFSMAGVLFNTIFPIIILPYVSRILGVDELGEYNYCASMTQYLQIAIAFGTSMYGVREIGKHKDNIDRISKLYSELSLLGVIFWFLILIILLTICYWVDVNFNIYIFFILYFPILLGIIGPDWIYIGLEKQGYILSRNVIIKLISLIVIFLLVKSEEDLLIYVFIIAFGQAVPSLINFLYLKKIIKIKFPKLFKIKENIKPLFLIFIVEILFRFLGLGDITLLGILQSDYSVGIYSMAQKVVILSTSVLNITATALLPKASYLLKQDNIKGFINLTKQTIFFLFAIGVILCGSLYLLSDWIILILGGPAFSPSAKVLRLLSFLLLIVPILNMMVFQVLYPQGKTKFLILLYSIATFVCISSNLLLTPRLNYYGTIISYYIVEMIVFSILIIKNKVSGIIHLLNVDILLLLIFGIISLSLTLLSKLLFSNDFMQFLIFNSCYLSFVYYKYKNKVLYILSKIKL